MKALEALEQGFESIPLAAGLELRPYTESRFVLTPNRLITVSARPHAWVVDTATNTERGAVYLRFSTKRPLPEKAGPLAAHLVRTAAESAGYVLDLRSTLVLDTATGVWHHAPLHVKILERNFSDAMWTLGGTWMAREERES